MAYYDNQDLYNDPALQQYLAEIEQDKRRKQGLASQFQENRTLQDYVANTPKGQKRFTNIPGQGADTFLMKEQPLQAPAGLSNGMKENSPYGVDPYDETRKIAEGLQAEGKPVDVEKIFRGVRDELSRQDEAIRQKAQMDAALTAKFGYGKNKQGDVFNKGTGEIAYKAPVPQEALSPRDQLDMLKVKQFKNAMNAQAALEEALAVSPDLQAISDEDGNIQNVAGLISEKDYKAANDALKRRGYKLVGTKAVYKDNWWPGANDMGYQVSGIRRTTAAKGKTPKSKGTRIDKESLASQLPQKRFRELQQLVSEREKQGITNGMQQFNPEQYTDFGDVFGQPTPDYENYGSRNIPRLLDYLSSVNRKLGQLQQ